MDENKLITGLKRGDYKSYETLFNMYYARFVIFVDKIIMDNQTAKDIVQEAFIKLWHNRERLQEGLSLKNYLYVLVKRASLNFLRDRKYAENLAGDLIEKAVRQEDPDQTVDKNEVIQRINSLVDNLPDRRKAVFLKSRKDGLSNKEIANQLNLSVKTVERHITLALSDLKKNLSS